MQPSALLEDIETSLSKVLMEALEREVSRPEFDPGTWDCWRVGYAEWTTQIASEMARDLILALED